MENIFIHDAVPTWSGFLYQGQIAVYLAAKKICELDSSGHRNEIGNYRVEMEKCEDIALVYEGGKGRRYVSIHQVKNQEDKSISKYKKPLTQLMLEKGFCKRNNFGVPEAYLHVSNKINITDNAFSEKAEEWKKEILNFHLKLHDLLNEMASGKCMDETLERLSEYISKKTIDIERKAYNTLRKNVSKACQEKDSEQAEQRLKELICFIEEKFCVTDISSQVSIYCYEDRKSYCSGTDVFEKIVGYVKEYKKDSGNLTEGQYEYIADNLLHFVNERILKRHKNMQEKKDASYEIPLLEFKERLDNAMESYEGEANVLALRRIYDQHAEEYCRMCQRENGCQGEVCKLQQPEYRRNVLEKGKFIKFCYNLNPECRDGITDRICLGHLLTKDGMIESVFSVIKELPEDVFIKKTDEVHFEVMNQGAVAFITAISGGQAFQVVDNIVRAMETNQDLIETIFDADQLVTTRIDDESSIWDSSCIKISDGDLESVGEEGEDYEEKSIYVAKKPKFVKAESLIENLRAKE